MTQAVARFVIETQCIGLACIALAVAIAVGLCLVGYAIHTAPTIEDAPEDKGISDIRP